MKKRLLCLLMCLIMVLSVVLTSCSEKTDEEAKGDISDKASEAAITLSMWVVCEEEISADNQAAVTAAINAITTSKFKTKLAIEFLTEDVYRTKLDAAIAEFKLLRESTMTEEEVPEEGDGTETDTTETETFTDATETNDLGMTVIKYPELLANQVDIIYISGEDMYIDYIENGWLAELDTELQVSSKKLKEYISGTLLSAAQMSGKTYAIPNNRTIGEYKYMLLNQELMQKYNQHAYWEQGMIKGFYNENLYSFLNLVYLFEENVLPVDSTYEECLDMLAHYWYIDAQDYSVDLNKFSVFGYHYDNMEDLNRGSVALGFESLFANEEFAESFLKLNEFRLKDYFPTKNETRKDVAVKFITGDATILGNGEYIDENGVAYYPVVVGYPTASSEDIYGNMFGVCKYTLSVSRSMEIVTYLNTNSELRNLLQYGVEDLHYTLVETPDGHEVVKRNTTDSFKYMMNIYATGNTFIAYPDPKENMGPDVWENGKIQNRNSLVDPLLGFDFKGFMDESFADTGDDDYVILDEDGYNVAYTTGYSKAMLGQNATLKNWLETCDAQGAGVYALKTYEVIDGTLRMVYYLYNSTIDAKESVTVSIGETPMMEDKEDSKTHQITQEQVGLNLSLTYTTSKVASDTKGYEITVLSVDAVKNGQVNLTYKVNDGTPAAYNTTEQATRVAFDFMNTQTYAIKTYELTRSTVIKNTTLINWVLDKHENASSTKPENFLLTCQKTLENGKKETIYVVLRARMASVTTLNVQPTGDSKNLVVNFNFAENPDLTFEPGMLDYIFTYVSVIHDSNVKVSPAVSMDDIAATFKSTETAEIQYDRFGTLDTDLIKFMQEVNDAIPGIFDKNFKKIQTAYQEACAGATEIQKKAALKTACDDLEALIGEFKKLLSVDEMPSYSRTAFPKIYNDIRIFCVDDRTDKVKAETLAQFHRNVCSLASYETVPYKVTSPSGQFDPYGNNEGTEAFVYFDSPYKLYYEWMKKYNFLPDNMQKDEEASDEVVE